MLPSTVVAIEVKSKEGVQRASRNQIKLSTRVKPVPFCGLTGRHHIEAPGCAYIEGREIASPPKSRIYVRVFSLIKNLLV